MSILLLTHTYNCSIMDLQITKECEMEYLNLALQPEAKTALKQIAKAQDRKMNRIVTRYIRDEYRETFGEDKAAELFKDAE